MSVSLVDVFKMFINTAIRIAPIGLYTGAAISGAVFDDFRGVLLFGGFIGNELLALGYKMVLKGNTNPQCALTYSESGTPFVLPSPISQTIGFFIGFLFMDMYFTNIFSPSKFIALTILQIMAIYSRVNVGCKTLLDAIFCSLIGMLTGVIYYNLVKDYYKANYMSSTITQADTAINKFFSIN